MYTHKVQYYETDKMGITHHSNSYKKVTLFPEVISIEVKVLEFKGVKLKLGYVMKNSDNDIVCEASSVHGFLNKEGCPIRLKKDFPEFYRVLSSLID